MGVSRTISRSTREPEPDTATGPAAAPLVATVPGALCCRSWLMSLSDSERPVPSYLVRWNQKRKKKE